MPRWLLGALLTVGVIALAVVARNGGTDRSRRVASQAPAVVGPRLREADLVVDSHVVLLPEAYVTLRDWAVPRRWKLRGYDRSRAVEVLRGVPGAAEGLVCDHSGCALWPSADALVGLSTATRSRVYNVLAGIDGNPQADDAFHRAAERGPFSAIEGLPPDAGRWLDAFTWSQRGAPTFSDLAAVCARLPTHADCNALVRRMLSRSSASVGLRVGAPGVIERAVAEFAPDRHERVRGALRSAASAGATTVPLASLLPAWAQGRLDTFPTPAEDWTNCFWTSLRFLDRAPGVVANDAEMAGALAAQFSPVVGSPRFGDILVLRDERGAALHAANVLLAGYAFTKNGFGHLQAWRIVPTAELLVDFPGVASVEFWRTRTPAL